MNLNKVEREAIRAAEAINGLNTMSKVDRILGRLDRRVKSIIDIYNQEFVGVPKEQMPAMKRIITALVAEGAPLREVLRMVHEHLGYSPSFATVLQWQLDDAEFDASMRLADRARAEAIVDLATNIALGQVDQGDGPELDDPEKMDHVDATVVAERKLQVHHLQWLATKLDPNRYGEKKAVDMKISGTIEQVSTDNLEQRLKALLEDPTIVDFTQGVLDVKVEGEEENG